MTDVRSQVSDGRCQRTEMPEFNEFGSWNAEVGNKKVRRWEGEKVGKEEGSRTRRRPIRRDYAAAKDAECGKMAKVWVHRA